jgi:EAL and modified HD-GYP domain-containing signal transduction protein
MNPIRPPQPHQDKVFLARQPIVDLHQDIIGYELLFRHNASAESAQITDAMRADVNILENILTNMGTNWLLGNKLAFINISLHLLKSDLIDLLPAGQFVLELPENFPVRQENLELCKRLQGKGFRFALGGFIPAEENLPLLGIAAYAKLEAAQLDAGLMTRIAAPPASPRVIATKVETRADFSRCKDLGVELFQGYYFAKPENLSAKTLNPALMHVLDLLNKVRMNAEMKEIEQVFKLDVALSYRLLRYINSAAMHRRTEVPSIRSAITLLGYQQLYRWLTLLLVTTGDESSPALVKTAVTRGRLTELLGQTRLNGYESDNLFIVGVFSLLDSLLDMPMDKVLEQVSLPEPICDAILGCNGIYSPYLSLSKACEAGETWHIARLAEELSIDPEQVNRLHLDALSWTENMGL